MAHQRLVRALPAHGWIDPARWPPLRSGLGIAAGAFLLFLALMLVTGRWRHITEVGAARELRIALVLCLLLGFAPAALGHVWRGLQRHVPALAPLLPPGAVDAMLSSAGKLPERTARWAGLAGLACGLLLPFAVDRDPSLYLQAAYWRPESIFHWTMLPLVSWSLTRSVVAIVLDARRLSALADQLTGFDLLDLQPLAPFSRQGLRVALLPLVLVSIWAILVRDQGFAPIVAAGALGALALASSALLLPVRGVHRRLRREKSAEIARVRAALRGERGALAASQVRGWAGVVSLADLLAYEARVLSVPEWPFDLPTLFRFGLYLLIPLGSWLGGAFAERLLGYLLG
jgi:hypothetical protein